MSIFCQNLFKNSVSIVTGGGSGIGRGIAYELLKLGSNVVIASRNKEKLDKAVDQLTKVGNVVSIVCNIRQEEQVKSLIEETIGKYGKLDYLVNNAGGQFISSATDISLKGWNAVIDTNLNGTFLMCREAHRQWFKDHGGSIVNIVADMWRGFPMMSHTGAARAAIVNLTQTLAVEWAGDGVRVNAVAPGVIYSPTAASNYPVDVFNTVKPHLLTQRAGVPEEVSSAVCFLLSPGASFISGACIKVDGGSSLYSRLMWDVDEHQKLPAYTWFPDLESPSKE